VPIGEPHQRQKSKNIALLLMLVALVVMLFAISVVKLAG
jgi:hypothetical protein